ncbi:MAG: hypothetical protein AAB576_01295, partial [Elusimicrobiota bacterium]
GVLPAPGWVVVPGAGMGVFPGTGMPVRVVLPGFGTVWGDWPAGPCVGMPGKGVLNCPGRRPGGTPGWVTGRGGWVTGPWPGKVIGRGGWVGWPAPGGTPGSGVLPVGIPVCVVVPGLGIPVGGWPGWPTGRGG